MNPNTHAHTHTSRQTKPIVFSTVTTEATNNNQIMMLEQKTMFDNDMVLRLSFYSLSSMDECMYACNICNKPLNLTVYYDYYKYKRISRGVKRLKQKQLRKNILLTESELLWPESVNRVFHASEDATGTVVAKMYHELRHSLRREETWGRKKSIKFRVSMYNGDLQNTLVSNGLIWHHMLFWLWHVPNVRTYLSYWPLPHPY